MATPIAKLSQLGNNHPMPSSLIILSFLNLLDHQTGQHALTRKYSSPWALPQAVGLIS